MNTAAVRESWIGRVIDGKFPLLQWLGGSEGGEVFLTELQGQGQQKAAIKLIPLDAAGSDSRLAAWAASANLAHPHLLRLFHYGELPAESGRLLYAVMEFAEENLSQIIPERALTPDEAKEMLPPLLDALSYLHEQGFVHSRVKPSNILAVDNQLKLSSDRLVRAGELSGPMLGVYDAPEVGVQPAAPAADIWSLGVTLTEALSQDPPVWDRSTAKDPLLADTIPQPFAAIAEACLRVDPAQRCSISSIRARLHSSTSPLQAERATTDGTTSSKRSPALITAGLVGVALIAALWFGTHRRQATPPVPTQELAAPAAAPEVPAATQQAQGVVKGEVAERVLPNVSRGARSTITGKVRVKLRVTVGADGKVAGVKFESPGPSQYFARLAEQSARQWKFKPAQRDGQPVDSVWTLTYYFGRSSTEIIPTETSP